MYLGYLAVPALLVTSSCAPQICGEEGDYHPLQTCQHCWDFALSSFAKHSQGRALGFNESSTISGPEGIGSALGPSCPILPLIAYTQVCLTLCPKGFLAVLFLGPTGQTCSNGAYIRAIPLTDLSEFQGFFCSPLIWESLPAHASFWLTRRQRIC